MQYVTTNLSSMPSIRAHLRVHARFVLRPELSLLPTPPRGEESSAAHPRS